VPLGTAAPAGQIQIVDGCPEGGGAAAISAYEPPAWEAAKGAASEDEDEDDAGEDARLVQPPSPQSPLFPDTALRKGSRPVRRKSLDAAFIKEEAESKRGFLKLIVMLLLCFGIAGMATKAFQDITSDIRKRSLRTALSHRPRYSRALTCPHRGLAPRQRRPPEGNGGTSRAPCRPALGRVGASAVARFGRQGKLYIQPDIICRRLHGYRVCHWTPSAAAAAQPCCGGRLCGESNLGLLSCERSSARAAKSDRGALARLHFIWTWRTGAHATTHTPPPHTHTHSAAGDATHGYRRSCA
jgi:hypothetical protein